MVEFDGGAHGGGGDGRAAAADGMALYESEPDAGIADLVCPERS